MSLKRDIYGGIPFIYGPFPIRMKPYYLTQNYAPFYIRMVNGPYLAVSPYFTDLIWSAVLLRIATVNGRKYTVFYPFTVVFSMSFEPVKSHQLTVINRSQLAVNRS